jgi:hypothetical protein
VIPKEVQALLEAPVAPLPAVLAGKVDTYAWKRSILLKDTYSATEDGQVALLIAMQTLSAKTSRDVLDGGEVIKLQELVPNQPNESVGPFLFTDLLVCSSDYFDDRSANPDGNPTFVVMTVVDVDTGVVDRVSTGATQIQVQCLRQVELGEFPFRGEFVRTRSKDKGGRYILKLKGV